MIETFSSSGKYANTAFPIGLKGQGHWIKSSTLRKLQGKKQWTWSQILQQMDVNDDGDDDYDEKNQSQNTGGASWLYLTRDSTVKTK